MPDHKDHAALAPHVAAIRKFHENQIDPKIRQAAVEAIVAILVFFQAGTTWYFHASEVRSRLAYRGHKLNVGIIRHLLHCGARLGRFSYGADRSENALILARPGNGCFYFAASLSAQRKLKGSRDANKAESKPG